MANLIIDVELGIPQDKFLKLNELSNELGKTLPETVELCLYDKCEELLKQFKENVPQEDVKTTTNKNDEGNTSYRSSEAS